MRLSKVIIANLLVTLLLFFFWAVVDNIYYIRRTVESSGDLRILGDLSLFVSALLVYMVSNLKLLKGTPAAGVSSFILAFAMVVVFAIAVFMIGPFVHHLMGGHL